MNKKTLQKKAFAAIPTDARDAVADWLYAAADRADEVADEMAVANRQHKDESTRLTIEHWRKMSACARLYGYQCDTRVDQSVSRKQGANRERRK